MADYLYKRGEVWWFRLAIPKDCREKILALLDAPTKSTTRREINFTLRTCDKKEAQTLAYGHACEWQSKIQEVRNRDTTSRETAIKKRGNDLLTMRKQHAGGTTDGDLIALGGINREVNRMQSLLSEPERTLFSEAHGGKGIRIDSHIDAFLADDHKCKAKTKQQRRREIVLLAERFTYWSDIKPKALNDWIAADTRSPKTKQRALSDWGMYWKYLKHQELTAGSGDSPLLTANIRPTTSANSPTSQKRQAFKPEEIATLIKGAMTANDKPLHDLIILAAYTGARIEELASRTTQHIEQIDGINSIHITEGKTEAATRYVPIHPQILPLIERLSADSTDTFLVPSNSNNQYGTRSPSLSKRFTRLRNSLGFPPTKVFHSIRKTFTTGLERLGVPEGTTADIVGHKKATITYGLYSEGMSIRQKAEAVAKLTYPGLGELLVS
jgi:integrase